jgi:hypothetical protein
MLTCSFDVVLLAGSSLYSAAGWLLCTISGLGRSLGKRTCSRWAAVNRLAVLHVGHEQLLQVQLLVL